MMWIQIESCTVPVGNECTIRYVKVKFVESLSAQTDVISGDRQNLSLSRAYKLKYNAWSDFLLDCTKDKIKFRQHSTKGNVSQCRYIALKESACKYKRDSLNLKRGTVPKNVQKVDNILFVFLQLSKDGEIAVCTATRQIKWVVDLAFESSGYADTILLFQQMV